MALGVRGSCPIWLLADLQGNLFDASFYMYVLQNTIPYLPAKVYHDPDLNTAWTSPIRFLGNGTLPVDIYFESGVRYRLEFRQNNGIDAPSQADPLIYEVDNYIAGTGGSTPVDTVAFASSNQITNPQFSLINFTSPLSLVSVTDPEPIEIGPGWFLDVAGTGSVTLTKVPLNNANANPSNAPYALRINISGWTAGSVFLRQRFQQNGMLWASTPPNVKYVSSTITARLEGIPQNISARLVDSNSTTLATVLPITAINESWNEFTGYGADSGMPETTNPDMPPAAYIDYKLELPNNIDIYVSSIQLVVQDLPFKPSFEQDSIERQIDHTFHYYKPGLEYKPIPSYLTGWDFPLNPAQFTGSTVAATAIGANKSKYVWDQTIIFQSANSGVGVTRGNGGQLVLTAAAATQMAIIQYLDSAQARKILNSPICSNISAKASASTIATVSLWYTTDVALPVISDGTNNSIVLSLDANGKPATRNGNWTEVPKLNGSYPITIGANATTNFNDYALNGWDMQGISACDTATFFAIVIGTAPVTIATTVEFNSVSLQAGTIATRPAPQSTDEVLRECRYYWEKSYPLNLSPGAISPAGAVYILNELETTSTNKDSLYLQSIWFDFKETKRVVPIMSYWSPTGSADVIQGLALRNNAFITAATGTNPANYAIGNWTPANYTTGVRLACTATSTLRMTTTTQDPGDEGQMRFQYVSNARLGDI